MKRFRNHHQYNFNKLIELMGKELSNKEIAKQLFYICKPDEYLQAVFHLSEVYMKSKIQEIHTEFNKCQQAHFEKTQKYKNKISMEFHGANLKC